MEKKNRKVRGGKERKEYMDCREGKLKGNEGNGIDRKGIEGEEGHGRENKENMGTNYRRGEGTEGMKRI